MSVFKSKLSWLVGMTVVASSFAHAAGPDDAMLSLASMGKVTVATQNGKHYSSVIPSNLQFHGSLHVVTKQSRVDGYAVYLGRCRWNCAKESRVTMLDSGDLASKFVVNKKVSFRIAPHALTRQNSSRIETARLMRFCQSTMRGIAGRTSQTITRLVPLTLTLHLITGGNASKTAGHQHASKIHTWRRVFMVPILVTCDALNSVQMTGATINN